MTEKKNRVVYGASLVLMMCVMLFACVPALQGASTASPNTVQDETLKQTVQKQGEEIRLLRAELAALKATVSENATNSLSRDNTLKGKIETHTEKFNTYDEKLKAINKIIAEQDAGLKGHNQRLSGIEQFLRNGRR